MNTLYFLLKKMSMNIHQIIEMWRGLSPRLIGTIPGEKSADHQGIDEKE